METNHDVFISHSSADSKLAYAICHYLEERGIRCWIAPRDVQGGMEYAESIILGIRNCKIMVVLFNENANNSLFVKNEVERAFNYKSIIIPFKVEDTIPSATLELFLGSVHWLDAVKGKAEDYFDLLYQNCARTLGVNIKVKPETLLRNDSKYDKLSNHINTLESKKNTEAVKQNFLYRNKNFIIITAIGLIISWYIIINTNWYHQKFVVDPTEYYRLEEDTIEIDTPTIQTFEDPDFRVDTISAYNYDDL